MIDDGAIHLPKHVIREYPFKTDVKNEFLGYISVRKRF